MTTLLEAFEPHLGNLVIDSGFVDRIYKYQTWYLNRDAEHLAFFGSNLIGVHAIQFRTSDTQRFYRDVLRMDYVEIERAMKTVTTIEQKFKVTSDAFNLTIMYLIHRVGISGKLAESKKKRGVYDLALIFFYRCIAIRQSEYFHIPADPKIAQAAYAELSNRFLIKQLGSWKAVMDYRAKELIDPKGLHYQNLLSFKDDEMVTRAIADSENRIRDMYKNYCAVFYNSHAEGSRINVASSTQIDPEGVEHLKEKVKHTEQAVNYLRTILHDDKSFVKQPLVDVILRINTNTSQRMLVHTLKWLSHHVNTTQWHHDVDAFTKAVVVYSFYLLQAAELSHSRDLPAVLVTLKNLYLSTRSVDPDLEEIRRLGEKLFKAANGKTNKSLMMATRTALILYITLRVITQEK